ISHVYSVSLPCYSQSEKPSLASINAVSMPKWISKEWTPQPRLNRRLPQRNRRLPRMNRQLQQRNRRLPRLNEQLSQRNRRLPRLTLRLQQWI
ncbi:hypothetical protein PMAYCL1PPCAC_21618, partial [Pristionchus mayeri]